MVHYRCLIHTAEGDFFPVDKFSLTLPVLSQDIQSQNEKYQNSQPQSALHHGYCLLQIHDSAVPELKSVSFVKTIWLELNDRLFGINKQKKLTDGDAPHF